jgi:cytochrome c5
MRMETRPISLHHCNMSRARRLPAAIVAPLMLLVSAGCGGRTGDADATQLQSPGLPDENDPRRPAANNAPTAGSAPSVDTLPTSRPDISPAAQDTPSRRERYVSAFQSVEDILKRNCGACHSKSVPTAPCGLRFDDSDDMVTLGVITPLDFERSVLSRVIFDGSMPPPGARPRPDTSEIEQLRAFIDNPEFWSTLPPDNHINNARIDAQNNACKPPEPAVDAGAAADAG